MKTPAGFRGTFRVDELARAVYSESAGTGRIIPAAVAVPADADDVVTLVKWAAAGRIALTPRGSGSSMANGAIGPGVIVDLGRLRHTALVGSGAMHAIAGAGVIRDDLDALTRSRGLHFPVEPSSSAFATIGGMCATHAAGARQPRYGPLRDWVVALECVFADGSRAWLRRSETTPSLPLIDRFLRDAALRVREADPAALMHVDVRKESSGYALAAWRRSGDLVDLILGNEGTLAIIVAAELRLAPLPPATASLLAAFPDLNGAAAAAMHLTAAGASAVELLDRSFLSIAALEGADLPLPAAVEAVLIVEVDGADDADVRAKAAKLAGWCEAGGALRVDLALGPADEEALWRLRHAASPILTRLAPRLQSLQLVEDGCVPPARFAEYVRGVRAALGRAGFDGVIFGHAGDAHAHVNALVDTTSPDWRERCERLVEEVTAWVTRLGGTIAGEHGDGRLRAPLLERAWSPRAISLFTATKRAFDPDGILNPGVKLPAPGAPLLGDIKYDPALSPLPAAARAALDLVVKEKAWARHRLDLL